ncbi:ExbD/TolR family protein [Marinimicrobium agarilyticum]|uniref:ExbD/TolR family protein n=1 Tax=Marinimicrobium agarilyticum TaxID=306546 RepID=UPI0003FF66D8|nr:biopolymer transporter ExbD [Marinimicrobium agarilyticum]
MQFRRQPRENDSINLTPLIDVVFLLLIFFMVSTTFTKETHLNIDLPEADGDPSEEAARAPIDIVITAEGAYSVNGRSLVNSKIATLKSALEKVSEGDSELPLTITADAQAPHESVVRAMDAAGQLGFVHLSITTRRPESGE